MSEIARRNLSDERLTAVVLESFEGSTTPRIKEVMQALVKHLHAFATDVQLTEEEWAYGIDFLTRTGHITDDKRQEFILLSDTLGVSMLVDAINHRMPEGATETTVLGPFYVADAPEAANGADISGGLQGQPLYVEASVASAAGAAIAEAIVDVWHSDDDGFYDVQNPALQEPALRARFRTGPDGEIRFWSTSPPYIRSATTARSGRCWPRRSGIHIGRRMSIS